MRCHFFILIIFLGTNVLLAYPNKMLWEAANAGDLAGVMKALSRKANINARSDVDEWGRTALHMAVENQKAQVVRYLVSLKNINLNIQDDLERTPLHIAAGSGNIFIIAHLLRAGANKYLRDCELKTPYNIAVDMGDDIAAFVLE